MAGFQITDEANPFRKALHDGSFAAETSPDPSFEGLSENELALQEAKSSGGLLATDYNPDKEEIYCYPLQVNEKEGMQHYIAFRIFDTAGTTLKSRRSSFDISKNAKEVGESLRSVYNNVFGPGNSVGNIPLLSPAQKDASFETNIYSFIEGTYDFSKKIPGLGAVSEAINREPGKPTPAGQINRESYTREVTGLSGLTEKVKKSIYLYIPANLATSYGFTYTDADMTAFSAIPQIMDMIKNGKLKPGTSDEILRSLGSIPLKVLDSLAETVGIKNLNSQKVLETNTRQVQNRFVEYAFEGSQRRAFTYSFNFSPKSFEESEVVYNIIHTFKRYSHPSRSDGGRFLNYPAEFEILYYAKTNENLYLNRIARCALDSINVDYSGEDGSFTAFRKNDKGAPPVQVKLELKFTELELLTRERIDQGF